MSRLSIEVLCFVAGVILISNYGDVEANVIRKVPNSVVKSSNDEYPFIDGLRVKPLKPKNNQSDSKEVNSHESFGEVADSQDKVGNDGIFPFKNGLRKRNRTSENPESEFLLPQVRSDEERLFTSEHQTQSRSGSLSSHGGDADDLQNFFDNLTKEHKILLCNSGNFWPFVDCLHFRNSTTTQAPSTTTTQATTTSTSQIRYGYFLRGIGQEITNSQDQIRTQDNHLGSAPFTNVRAIVNPKQSQTNPESGSKLQQKGDVDE